MLEKITQPTLIIDKKKCIRNISLMKTKAERFGLEFRPHFKTHQSGIVGNWFRVFGINKITVSSVSMAEYFAREGWDDITIAFPVNIREINKINQLAGKIRLNLLVESEEAVGFLNEHLTEAVSVFVKIDVGYHRTGINPEETEKIDKLIKMISSSERMQWIGFLTHAGHTYQARNKEEVLRIHQTSLAILSSLKARYQGIGEKVMISYGDTPSCSLADDFSGIDEIRPGNFVYYDVMQWRIGSCSLDDIAVSVACPVVAKHEKRNEVVIYGGAVHLSKDSVELEDETCIYGLAVWLNEKGWEIPTHPIPVIRLSQEHGILKVPDNDWNRIHIGDLIGILPVHSCLSANLLKENQVILTQ